MTQQQATESNREKSAGENQLGIDFAIEKDDVKVQAAKLINAITAASWQKGLQGGSLDGDTIQRFDDAIKSVVLAVMWSERAK